MWRALTVIGLAAVLGGILLVLLWGGGGCKYIASSPAGGGKAAADALTEWVKNNPKGKSEAVEKPAPKDNVTPKVDRREREAMGLPAPTWLVQHGKVQPAVRKALEVQKKLPETSWRAMYQGERPAGFQGTAYVDVYLRHQAKGDFDSEENRTAIKEAQEALLTKLTARELGMVFVFENTAGLVGYVNDAGLKKLNEDPEVLAVGIDDQARPKRPEPPPGERKRRYFWRGPTKMIGKVDAEVFTRLVLSGDEWVYVLVSTTQPVRREMLIDGVDVLKWQAENRILASLSAAEFRPHDRNLSMSGDVRASGLAKMQEHPDVQYVKWGIGYPRRLEGDDR